MSCSQCRKRPEYTFCPFLVYILLAQITLLENASRVLDFLVLIDEFPQILPGLFEAKCGGKHVPYQKIHPSQHIDYVKQYTVAERFDFVDTTLKIVDNLHDRFHYYIKTLIYRF